MFPNIGIGPFEISTWRLVVFLAVILSWMLMLKRSGRLGYPTRDIFYWMLSGMLFGFAGAYVFNVLIPYLTGPKDISSSESVLGAGMTIIGAIVLCIVYSVVYLKYVLKLDPWPVLDAAAFTMPLCIAIGRVGCLLNGCCFGRASPDWAQGTPLALLTLRKDSFLPHTFADQHLPNIPGGTMLWNFQVMESINALLALAVAELLFRNKGKWRLPHGAVFSTMVAIYAFNRFWLEFLREEAVLERLAVNPWQVAIALLFAVFFAYDIWLFRSRGKRDVP